VCAAEISLSTAGLCTKKGADRRFPVDSSGKKFNGRPVASIFFSSHGIQIRMLLPFGRICSGLHRIWNSPLTENHQIAPVRVQFGGILSEAGV
jgi:hypothetical protein